MKTIYEYILSSTNAFKNSTAIVHNSKQINYRNLLQKVVAISDQLILEGLHKGDRIIIDLTNPINQFIVSLATIRAGGVAVPIERNLDIEELHFILKNIVPFTIITDDNSIESNRIKNFNFPHFIYHWSDNLFNHLDDKKYHENLEYFENENAQKILRLIQPDISDLVYIQYVRESKKFIAYSHKNITYPSLLLNQILAINPSHRELITYPINNIHGFLRIIQNLISGSTSFLLQDIDQKLNIPAYIIKNKCNSLFSDVEFFNYLYSNLKSLTQESLRNSIIIQLNNENIFLIEELLKMDLTELKTPKKYLSFSPLEAPLTTLVNIEEIDINNLCMGLPLPGIKLKTLKHDNIQSSDFGILCINGNNTMEGYFHEGVLDKSNFTSDNWLVTNKYAFIDDKGRLFLKGTKEEILFIDEDIISLQQMNSKLADIFSELNCEYFLMLKEDIHERSKIYPILFFAPHYGTQIETQDIYKKILNLKFNWTKDLLIFKVKSIPKSGNKVIKSELLRQIEDKNL